MNDPNTFDTIGDPPVEARIVAWVLGEASAFESAELERLCEERPELLIFRRRMRALHGLLTEAEAVEADDSWKLPPEKRKALDEVFGEVVAVKDDWREEKSVRHSARRAFLAIAACLIITVVIAGLTAPMVIRQRKKADMSSSARMLREAEKTVDFMPISGGGGSAGGVGKPTDYMPKATHAKKREFDESQKQLAEVDRNEGELLKGKDVYDETMHLSPAAAPSQPAAPKGDLAYKVKPPAARKPTAGEAAKQRQLAQMQDAKGDRAAAKSGGDAAPELPQLAEGSVRTSPERLAGVASGLGSGGGFAGAKGGRLPPVGEPTDSGVEVVLTDEGKPIEEMASAYKTPVLGDVPLTGRLFAGAGRLAGGKGSKAENPGPPAPDSQEGFTMGLEANYLLPYHSDSGEESNRDKGAAAGRAGSDFVSPVDGTSVDGIPADPDQFASNGVTNGLRSGDQAISRNNIDAILNNPNRAPAKVPSLSNKSGEGKKAGADADESKRELGDDFGEMFNLSSLSGGRLSGGLGGTDSSKGSLEEEPIRTNPALTGEQSESVEKSKRELGYDHARAELLKNVEQAWELKPSAGLDKANEEMKAENGSLSSLASRELIRQQDAVTEGDTLLKEGREAYAKGDYEQASEKFHGALEKLPDTPMTEERRKSYTEHSNDADVALAMGNRKVGKYTEAKDLLDKVVAADPENAAAKRELAYLDDPIRTNPALAYEHTENVDKVRRGLYTAEGFTNLGKYDDARREYEKVLRLDPSNAAARRGMEQVAVARSDYYRAAYDTTRAELLTDVDSAWELALPADGNDAVLHHEPVKTAPLLTDLMEEIPASENPYSTFSLNISDASFQTAKAAIAKGERPDPESIKPEQFYNAVDYGDPAPTADEPVAATIEQSAHPVVPGRSLVRIALRTAATGHSAAQPLRLTLLVDQSGSMVREDRRAAMEQALAQLGGLLTKDDVISVVGFSRLPHLLAEGVTGDQAGKLSGLVNQTASEGGTNLEEAMKVGEQLALRHQLAGAQNRIVLFTDGAANLGNANPEKLAEQVKTLRQKGIAFDIAGIGADGLNDRLLGELARHGNGRYYVVSDAKNSHFADQLAGAFHPAAENVKVQVNFNPQRVGKYKLIGFEKDRLKTEDFRNDAVDAAELAAEEAGVAIYQVETLPEGTGEIGEVSVRFRDAASSEMVERSWTIPNEDSLSAFDRATPSMQLAGLSLLAAEKLKGGPLGDAIDFKLLAGPRAVVKQFYNGSAKVADMLRVIDFLQ